MAYLILYGSGWTQRWRLPEGSEEHVRSQISAVGSDQSGRIAVLDTGTERETTLNVAWAMVAAAVVLDEASGLQGDDSAGQYR